MPNHSKTTFPESKIDILIDQVGQLTQAVSIGFQDFRAERAELKEISKQQAEMAKQQAESMARSSVDLTELRETTKQQAETAKQQAESVACLATVVEKLIQ